MEKRIRWMEVAAAEQTEYLAGLRAAYGAGVLSADRGMQTTVQRETEIRRHRLNARLQGTAEGVDRTPRRLLVTVTQKCTLACPHCWAFGSPRADCSLSLADLEAIHLHTSAVQVPRWTVSGGEFFSLPHYAEALERFPIDCVYTNGFWGVPQERCRRTIDRIASALHANPYSPESNLTFILSYDRYHTDAAGPDLPLAAALANVIGRLSEALPGIAVRLSHARKDPGDTSYREVLEALAGAGFTVTPTDRRDRNGSITTLSYRYSKPGGIPKELFVDSYPIAPIGRALVGYQQTDPEASPSTTPQEGPARARYQYAVGPDGGVGLYQVLYAPPVPYWLGDLVREPWNVIAERVARDPLALTLETDGTGPILAFLERYFPALRRSLAPSLSMTQQFLYLALLDPDRRLLLNTWLIWHAHERGRLRFDDLDLEGRLQALLEAPEGADRQRDLHGLYGVDLP